MGKKKKINNNKKQKRTRKNSKCSEVGAKLVSLDNDVWKLKLSIISIIIISRKFNDVNYTPCMYSV